MRRLVLASAVFIAASIASAETNPLVGRWLTTYMDPRGITNYASEITVEPNGAMSMTTSVSGSGGSGQNTLFYSYQMTGENSFTARVIDYSPKQMCGVVCLPVQPIIPIGTTTNCQFSVMNNIELSLSCDGQQATRYSRE